MENILDEGLLTPPAICTLKCDLHASIIGKVKRTCGDLKKLVSNTRVLDLEMDVVKQLVYVDSSRLRLDKGFQLFRNVKRYFKKYNESQLQQALENFTSCLPEDSFGSSFYMPSRQLLQYLLHQIALSVAFLEKVSLYCQRSGYFFLERMRSGHSWSMSAVYLAVCARVSHFCRRLSWKCCKLFNDFVSVLPKLILSGPDDWPRSGYCYPKNLEETFQIENPAKANNKSLENEEECKPEIFKMLVDLDDSENEADDDVQVCKVKPEPITIEDDDISNTSLGIKLENIDSTAITIVDSQSNKKKRKKKKRRSEAALEISIKEENGEANIPPKKQKLQQEAKSTNTKLEPVFLDEKIDLIISLESLNNFLNREVNNSIENNCLSARRQVSGIVKSLKKTKSHDIEHKKLLIRAKDVLRSTLL